MQRISVAIQIAAATEIRQALGMLIEPVPGSLSAACVSAWVAVRVERGAWGREAVMGWLLRASAMRWAVCGLV